MSVIPKRSRYLGSFLVDPTPTEAGQWWFNITEGSFKFFGDPEVYTFGGIYSKTVSVPAEELGRPNTNPPGVVDQDNLTLYSFTVDTDHMTFKFPIPSDYDSGPFDFFLVWTNDGGADDSGKNVKWQLSYQVAGEGDPISGNHANSPKSVEDTYTSDSGWIEHHSGVMAVPAADFAGKYCIYLNLVAVTPVGTALTCEPHLIGLCFTYKAKRLVV